jgi:hypothetical protein
MESVNINFTDDMSEEKHGRLAKLFYLKKNIFLKFAFLKAVPSVVCSKKAEKSGTYSM